MNGLGLGRVAFQPLGRRKKKKNADRDDAAVSSPAVFSRTLPFSFRIGNRLLFGSVGPEVAARTCREKKKKGGTGEVPQSKREPWEEDPGSENRPG